jgi:hypothetical protein
MATLLFQCSLALAHGSAGAGDAGAIVTCEDYTSRRHDRFIFHLPHGTFVEIAGRKSQHRFDIPESIKRGDRRLLAGLCRQTRVFTGASIAAIPAISLPIFRTPGYSSAPTENAEK